jgi:hypothetical protein
VSPSVEIEPEEPQESRFRRASTGVVVFAIVAALLFACSCAVGSIFVGRSFVSETRVEYRAWVQAAQRVAWSGEGRFGVVQTSGADGEPVVVAWDAASDETHSVTGFRLAAVEPHSTIVWLVPITRAQLSEHPDGEWGSVLLPPDGPYDAAPGSLLIWDLTDAGGPPAPPVDPGWTRWPGPGVWSATALIDPARGAFPSELRLGESAAETDERRATLPDDFGTFDVAGWSPSGRYLAVAEMLDPTVPHESPRRIVIVDAKTGQGVAEAEQSASQGQGATPVWSPDGDVLVWTERALTGGARDASGGQPAMRAMEPGGEEMAALDVLDGALAPQEDADTRPVSVYGSGGDGVLIGRMSGGETALYWLGAVPERVALLPEAAVSAAYTPDSGLLVLAREYDEEASVTRDVLLHVLRPGDEERVVWEGGWYPE